MKQNYLRLNGDKPRENLEMMINFIQNELAPMTVKYPVLVEKLTPSKKVFDQVNESLINFSNKKKDYQEVMESFQAFCVTIL